MYDVVDSAMDIGYPACFGRRCTTTGGAWYPLLVLLTIFSPGTARIPIELSDTLPAAVDNSQTPYFPPIIRQQGVGCGNAAGIGHLFNYEINCDRGTEANSRAHLYPYFHTFAFLNNGDAAHEDSLHLYYLQYMAAWKIVRENGIPDSDDYGTSDLTSTAWLDGYDNWFRAMHNRVDRIDSLKMTDRASLDTMKQWLVDHGNGSAAGGVLLLTGNIYCCAQTSVKSGPKAGSSFLKGWGWSDDPLDPNNCRNSPHALVIVGYNDSVRCDFNGDGRFVNGDSLGTWEIGAVRVANSWGTAAWDQGFIWAGYRTLFLPEEKGGLLNGNYLYYVTVKKSYVPRLTFKARITCPIRNNLSISVGAAPGRDAAIPTCIRTFDRQFNYSGGPLPMRGNGASSSIEIGLDISDLIDSIGGNETGTYFLLIDSKGGTATVDSLFLMDYTGDTTIETAYHETGVPVEPGMAEAPVTTVLGIGTDLDGIAVKKSPFSNDRQSSVRIKQTRGGTVRLILPVTGKVSGSLYTLGGQRLKSFSSTIENGELLLGTGLPPGTWLLTLLYPDQSKGSLLLHLTR